MQVLRGISFLLLVQIVVVTGQECSEEGVVRLADGVNVDGVGVYGRVEICINQQWGTVCDDGWDVAEARVACSQLGDFDFANPFTEYGGGSGRIHSFSCAGNENGLLNCSSDLDVDYCYHFKDVGVRCYYAQCNETDVRLVDGRTPNYGRVEICFVGGWGSVCNDGWDERDAEVVCRQLGCDGRPIALINYPVLSNYPLQYHLDDVECSGSEDMLSDCAHGGIGVHDCMEMAEVAGVICSECNETDVRLVDGVTSDDGRVEICFSGLWGSVCDDSWDYRDARVVCQQLGYNGTSVALSSHRVLTDESLFYYLDDVDCRGNENLLSQCEHGGVGIHNCGVGHQEAGVICSNAVECNETDVRLVAGTTPYDGLVEICLYGLWGSVCDTRWDYRDAGVVCRQLGYDGPSYPLLSHDGSSELRYHLDDVHCEGTESSLSDCSHRGIGVHYCYLYEPAGVVCTNVTCIEGAVHLVGGDDVSRGRVAYCYNGTWYSVCASDWDTTGEEARVVCETLGYDTSYYASVVVNYGRGTDPILPLSIECGSGTSAFSDCSTAELDVSQCSHAAGVDCFAICTTVGLTDCSQCNGESCTSHYGCRCGSDCFFYGKCCPDISVTKNCFVEECEHGAVRLVGGLTDSTGRLELCALGVWGKVCNAFGYWGPDTARVVCRQLGFSEDGAYILKDDIERFGTSDKDAVIGKVHCIGTESRLLECSHSSIGFHYCSPYYFDYDELDIVISCYDEVRGCEDGEVRLDGGFTSSTGRMEVCMDRRWGGVCSDGFNVKDARVVCSELDFNPGDGAIIEGPVTLEASPVFVGSVTCTGSEQSFSECSHDRPPSGGCSVAAISCGMSSSNQTRCTQTFPTSVPELQRPTDM
ncbi:Deleted in malignant brain tumors 1 protein [Geodia barretti]|uniref:Deleted in malignant brain tumors 1 protein n=1 Tax=Geodia barretti TaxID=519541 RepID=A0AA35X6N4_GEOBA|nr:Deleted in malignant brain tumors 1 protein [Geodia barretti]